MPIWSIYLPYRTTLIFKFYFSEKRQKSTTIKIKEENEEIEGIKNDEDTEDVSIYLLVYIFYSMFSIIWLCLSPNIFEKNFFSVYMEFY